MVVDRLAVKASSQQRLTDSVETALGLAGGLVVLDFVDLADDDPDRERTFSEHLACTRDGLSFDELEPRSFSFNSPYGACPDCHGLGTQMEVDDELVVPDPGKSLAEGAIAPWTGAHTSQYFSRLLESLADEMGFDIDKPFGKLPAQGPPGGAARRRRAGSRPLQEPLRTRSARTTPPSRVWSPT